MTCILENTTLIETEELILQRQNSVLLYEGYVIILHNVMISTINSIEFYNKTKQILNDHND